MKKALLLAVMTSAICALQGLAAPIYTQQFGLDTTDAFGTSPYSATNAFIRRETFGPQDEYWQPTAPNTWSEVVYRFAVPFTIDTASMYLSVRAYTAGDPDRNFDDNAASYLDVSPDGINYTTVLASYPGHGGPYDSFGNSPNHDGDISSLVAGSSAIFVRARQFMTVDYVGFNASQFLRMAAGQTPFYVGAVGVPEPSSLVLAICGVSFVLFRRGRFDRKPWHATSDIALN